MQDRILACVREFVVRRSVRLIRDIYSLALSMIYGGAALIVTGMVNGSILMVIVGFAGIVLGVVARVLTTPINDSDTNA